MSWVKALKVDPTEHRRKEPLKTDLQQIGQGWTLDHYLQRPAFWDQIVRAGLNSAGGYHLLAVAGTMSMRWNDRSCSDMWMICDDLDGIPVLIFQIFFHAIENSCWHCDFTRFHLFVHAGLLWSLLILNLVLKASSWILCFLSPFLWLLDSLGFSWS